MVNTAQLHKHSARPSAGEGLDLIETLTQQVKSTFLAGLDDGRIDDLAFIGNASSHYPWIKSLMVDLDVFVFVDSLDLRLGRWLMDVRDELTRDLTSQAVDFELRIVEGPYKPAIKRLDRPVIVAHLGVFTEPMYLAEAPIKRWSWRKYACERDRARLTRLAPLPPDANEILNGEKGVRQRLRSIRSGQIEMREWQLPDFVEIPLHIRREEANFIECCFAYAANCARHHCRALRISQADQLGNDEFFPWYTANVFASSALADLMVLKMSCRNTGFDVDVDRVQRLAVEYMSSLEATLEDHLTGSY